MQWFKHDTGAYTDARIKKLVLKYGAEGYAIYFHCLELIAGDLSESNLTFELEHDAEIIADNLKIKSTSDVAAIDKVNEIMRYILELGLFESSNDRIFCFKLLKRLDQSMTGNVKMRKLIADAKEHNHDIVMTESCKRRGEENRIDENRKKDKRFKPPTIQEIQNYLDEKSITCIDAEHFFHHYEANGWMRGKDSIKNWKSVIQTWKKKNESRNSTPDNIFEQNNLEIEKILEGNK